MDDLYPPLQPSAEGMLDVGDGHRVYWQEAGNPLGKPVVVVHGGPGSGIAPMARRHFDPSAYRIILFDQRGAGRSTPSAADPGADLAANTLWHLVSDLELLRSGLNVEQWQVFGGSWGATLALAYAETHPDRVTELVLRGIFTARQSEFDWIYRGGAAHLFPAEWEDFLAPLPEAHRKDPLKGYGELLASEDRAVRERAAIAWSTWEGATVALVPQEAFVNRYADPSFALTFARLAVHYFGHGAWLDDGQLIRDAGKLAGIPGVLVQGRYDAVCPPITAYELHRAWPGSVLRITEGAGHAVNDPGTLAALRKATDDFR
ncbi:prolyl aminopeptidase [Amycolatopsis sp. FDAARGOS 1241]|uniref:prolyl aminopeptidase n=1 Tax=Amycolatopsis sp. FDAARGOS 1241 TaxID=2778070 RepID=UPI001950F182|nr:prolyl aminopeptidase [Amycolatopsis sp. FDAARGOS 1241]QRP44961.1 prolyl aminopeptidase [Amycolatopsis sp. FDAARGOS 1241]